MIGSNNRKASFIYNKWQIILAIYKLFGYNFLWNRLQFIDKIDLAYLNENIQ